MANKKIKGSCLCRKVAYEIKGPFKIFQYCHCYRCRKFTGSAHASNLFVPPEQFVWTCGEEFIGRYEHEDAKYFAINFCKQCGSSLPWSVQGGKNIVVTEGTLAQDPRIKPRWNIFWKFKAAWLEETFHLPKYDEFLGK